MNAAVLVARLLLVGVFAVSGTAKLADRQGTERMVGDFGVPPSWARPIARLLPVIELGCAAALLAARTAWYGALAAALLLGLFSTAIAVNLAKGNTVDCRCFGQIRPTPLSGRLLVRNAALGVLAVVVLLRGAHPWA